QTWQSPSGWDIQWAELRMLEPVQERIVGYPEIAMSVITYSNPGDVTAELVWVGSGTRDSDYAGKDVKGKFVLATGYGGAVHRLAVLKYGAKAVVCYLDDERAKEHPDMLQYTGMWPRTEELDRVTFGFNLTNRQGERLRRLLETGHKVVLRGQVKGIGLEPYFMDVVVARIPGSQQPDEEIVFSAHLDHPKESANDNASGSAAILDIARSLKTLIDSGRLTRPKRSLRFLWVPEWYGTMAYIDRHPELAGVPLGGKILADLNLDMVGENTELLHSKLILTRTPDSIPSVLDEVVANMAAMVDGMSIRTPRGSLSEFNYRMTPYSGGSDHMMFIERKVPAVMFTHAPDYTHHTSEDTPDKVDPVELERCEIIAAASALFLSDLDAREAEELAFLAFGEGQRRMAQSLRQAADALAATDGHDERDRLARVQNVLIQARTRAEARLASLLAFNDEPQIRSLVQKLQDALRRDAEASMALMAEELDRKGLGRWPSEEAGETDERVPVRVTRGPLDFGLPERKLSESEREWYATAATSLNRSRRFELVNFVDGNRTVSQIRDAVSAEFGPLELAVVSRYFEDLVRAGAMKWKAK
ncbi:MAG: DUF4910 domain-containing protein, partial [Calditrichaeota bacterium]